MSFIETLRDFQTLGCDDQGKCALAARVYLDLMDDARTTNLQRCYNADLQLLYLQGERDDATVLFVPMLSCQTLDLLHIEKIQARVCTETVKCITLAICDTASNILYYQCTSGIVNKQ